METILQTIADLGHHKALDEAKEFVTNTFPTGSGIDNGVQLFAANKKEVILVLDYHHMNGNGYYDGWTHHNIKITPSLLSGSGYDIAVGGKNTNDIKDYLYEIVDSYLSTKLDEVPQYEGKYFNYLSRQWEYKK